MSWLKDLSGEISEINGDNYIIYTPIFGIIQRPRITTKNKTDFKYIILLAVNIVLKWSSRYQVNICSNIRYINLMNLFELNNRYVGKKSLEAVYTSL